MTTKLHRIKSALRESIEMASKTTSAPWAVCEHSWQESSIFSQEEDKTICYLSVEDNEETVDVESVLRDANASFIAHARTMTPLACKALLLAIEGLEQTLNGIGNTDDRMSDENSFIVNSMGDLVEKTLAYITSEWPDA